MGIKTSDIRCPRYLSVHVLLKNRIDQFDLPLSADCSLEFIFDLAWLGSARPITSLKGCDIFSPLLPIMTFTKNWRKNWNVVVRIHVFSFSLYSAVSGNKENVLTNQRRSRWRTSLRNLSKENKNTKYENTNSKYENKRSLREIQLDLLCDMCEGTAD